MATTQRDRFYWRTIGYHVWGIFERHDDNLPISVQPNSDLDTLVESVGARRLGDDEAKLHARQRTFALNQRDGHTRANMTAIQVDWDTDGEPAPPSIVLVPRRLVQEYWNDPDNDIVADWLSDKYGWCVQWWQNAGKSVDNSTEQE